MPPRSRSFNTILKDSPLLNTDNASRLFPTKADKDALVDLGKKIDKAVKNNQSAAQIWKDLNNVKETAIKLLADGLGRTFPGL